MRKILIIGKSGSGKSRAANALALRTKYPTYVVNDNNNKNSEDDKVFPDIDWEELPRLKNANVIVEDLISCTNQQLESLKVLCNWSAHHRNLPLIIMIAHAVTKNNISSLLQNISHVYFMRNRSTVASVSFVLSKYYFTKEQRDRFVRDFLADAKVGPSWLYWTLDPEAGTFGRDSGAASTSDVAVPDTLGKYRKTAQHYLGLFCQDSQKAMAIFDYLLKKIPLQSLSADDLTMGLGGRREERVSMIDFIHALTTHVPPSREVLALNRHLGKFFKMPTVFVSNPVMKKDWLQSSDAAAEEEEEEEEEEVRETRIVRRRRRDDDDDDDDQVSSARKRKKK